MMSMPLGMFLLFVTITLVITYWAARRTSGANAFFAANRQIKGWQNGFAVAGDYMSAASFLGIAGIIAFQGYDGFMYSVGWLVAYLTVLLSSPNRCVMPAVHDGRRARLPPQPAAGTRDGLAKHDHREHLLYDRADGRRRRAGRSAAQEFRH
jgi:hypothetical protein